MSLSKSVSLCVCLCVSVCVCVCPFVCRSVFCLNQCLCFSLYQVDGVYIVVSGFLCLVVLVCEYVNLCVSV